MTLSDKFKVASGDKKKLTYLLLLAGLAMLLLIATEFWGSKEPGEEKEAAVATQEGNSGNTEAQLEAVLSKIKGVGDVSVAIEYDSSGKKEYAYNEEVSESTSGSDGDVATETTTRKEMVLLNGDSQGVLITDTPGKILGVLVVAEGASDASVREQIQNAVTACLDVGANRVAIYTMEV